LPVQCFMRCRWLTGDWQGFEGRAVIRVGRIAGSVAVAGPLLWLAAVMAEDVGATGFFRLEVDLDRQTPLTLDNEGFEIQVLQMLARDRVGGSNDHPFPSSTVSVLR
jgi:hypothetical protein